MPGYDVEFVGFTFSGFPGIFAGLADVGAGLVGRTVGIYNYADRLAAGTLIGPASAFVAGGGTLIYGNSPPISPPTSWHANETGFMGIRFLEGANTYFGWVRVSVGTAAAGRYPCTLVDWAFDNTPGTGITAGAGVPEPTAAALGFLALGALGSRAWRKQHA